MREHNLRRYRVLGQKEALDVVVQLGFALSSGEDEDNHLHAFIELLLEGSDPAVRAEGTLDSVDCGVSALVADLVKALLERALELVRSLAISVTVEDAPCLHGRLGEHLRLDLAVQLTGALLDVERVGSSAAGGTHDEISSIILEARDLSRGVPELEVPSLLLLLALLVLGEGGEEVFALLHLLVGIGVHDLGKILHEAEVSSHLVSEASELAELGDQRDLVARLPVLVDKERLVGVGDVLVVPGLVVLLIANLSAVLIEGR